MLLKWTHHHTCKYTELMCCLLFISVRVGKQYTARTEQILEIKLGVGEFFSLVENTPFSKFVGSFNNYISTRILFINSSKTMFLNLYTTQCLEVSIWNSALVIRKRNEHNTYGTTPKPPTSSLLKCCVQVSPSPSSKTCANDVYRRTSIYNNDDHFNSFRGASKWYLGGVLAI